MQACPTRWGCFSRGPFGKKYAGPAARAGFVRAGWAGFRFQRILVLDSASARLSGKAVEGQGVLGHYSLPVKRLIGTTPASQASCGQAAVRPRSWFLWGVESVPRMRVSVASLLALGVSLGLVAEARAATYYVGPEGSDTVCTRATPCALSTGAEIAIAGDTVVLLDGTYYEPLQPQNSGTPDAWITFQADECALPIIEGPGEGILEFEPGEAPSGVSSSTGTYLRFVGLVSRYWDSGFTNGWTGEGTTNSNGHFEYINCIGDGNGRTGMVLYSAPNITIRESISAHNGGNPVGSWSSGIQLYAVQGTADDNIIERNVSFENTDAEKNSDGSGFIVDEDTLGATFINNLAFRNGGSCMRLTRSPNTRMINFTCYHNGLNPNATGPTNPGEFYFTDEQSRSTAIVINTLAAAAGTPIDPQVFMFPPTAGLSNNYTVDSGPTPFYTDPEGVNPDFRPPASSAAQVENLGSVTNAPFADLGFDPKCIVRQDPQVPFQQSWWTHAIDYDYIRSIGGVARCFHPKERTSGVDIGAYELSGEPHAFSVPGSCVPIVAEEEPVAEPGDAGIPEPMPDDLVVDDTGGDDVVDDTAAPVDPLNPDPTTTSSTAPTSPSSTAPTSTPGASTAAPSSTGVMNGLANPVPLAPPSQPAQPTGAAPFNSVLPATTSPAVSPGQNVGPAPAGGAGGSAAAGPTVTDGGNSASDSGCTLSPRSSAQGLSGAWLALLGLSLSVWRRVRGRRVYLCNGCSQQ
jgi:hypothetical protein